MQTAPIPTSGLTPFPNGTVEIGHRCLGPLTLVTVNNPITFDPINDAFTDLLYIRGALQQPISAYTIKIYSDDSLHTLLATINGAPSGDTIDDSWDFTTAGVDVQGSLVAELSFPQEPQVPQPIVKHYSMERCFPANSLTLGWGWDFGTGTQLANRGQYVRMGLVDMLGTDLNGPEFDLLPPGSGGNVPYTSSFQVDGSQSAHDRLLYSIADSASFTFFFWGHGSPNSLSWTRSPARPSDEVTSDEIATQLGNPGRANGNNHPYEHTYRFVFLDACGSYTREMCRAFGVPFSTNGSAFTVAEYLQWHRIPRAFVGWDVTVMGSDITDDLADLYRVTAQQTVLGYWQAGGSVQDAMAAWDAYLPDKRCLSSGTLYKDVDPNAMDITLTPPKRLGIYPPMKTWKLSGCRDLNRFSPVP